MIRSHDPLYILVLGKSWTPARRRLDCLAVIVALAGAPVSAAAGEVELTLQANWVLPFYSQTFRLDPDSIVPPGGPIRTSGSFQLDGKGGIGWGASLAWHFAGPLALEARFDSAAIGIEVAGGQVETDLGDLIPGLPPLPIGGTITGVAEIERLTPFSLNLHYGAGERVRFVASGGVSFMPATTLVATVGVGLQTGGIPGIPSIDLPRIGVTAAATLDGSVGGNLGVGVRVPLSPKVSLLFDGRVFGFPEREVEWGRGSGDRR